MVVQTDGERDFGISGLVPVSVADPRPPELLRDYVQEGRSDQGALHVTLQGSSDREIHVVR